MLDDHATQDLRPSLRAVTIIGIDGSGSAPGGCDAASGDLPIRLFRAVADSPSCPPGMVECRLVTRPASTAGHDGGAVMAEVGDALCRETELTWIHYAGPVGLEHRVPPAGPSSGRGEGPLAPVAVLLPHDGRPPTVAMLMDLGAMSPAGQVVLSLDVEISGESALAAIGAQGRQSLGPKCALIAVESTDGTRAFTRRLTRLVGEWPERVITGDVLGLVTEAAGCAALVVSHPEAAAAGVGPRSVQRRGEGRWR